MFIKIVKELSYHERTRNNKTFRVKHTKKIVHFICDNCSEKFTRAFHAIDSKRCNNTVSHYCNSCPAFALAAQKGRLTRRKNLDKDIGKRTITTHGYVRIYVGKTHQYSKDYGGSLLEHTFVMENYLNRAIKKNEVIHHINGIKTDNNIKNLDVMTMDEHNKCHGHAANALLRQLFDENIIRYDRNTKRYVKVEN